MQLALGQFKDRIDVVEAAAAYLEFHSVGDESAQAVPAPSSPKRWPRVIELYPCRGADIHLEKWRHPIGA